MKLKKTLKKIDIIGFIISLLIMSIVAFYSLVVFWPLSYKENPVNFEIKKGASLSQIALELSEKNIIDDLQTFILAATMMGHEKNIKAGIFSLTDFKSNYNIITQLVNGNPVLKKITFPEGLTIKQISIMLENKLNVDKKLFIDLCYNQKFIRSNQIKAPSLEGFLFPETYYFQNNEKPIIIIKKMLKEYKDFFNKKIIYRLKEINFTELELLTLASIIEGEALYNIERPIISSVYHNRLKKNMRLQADPTIQYIIKDSPRRLFNKDLKIQSLYNTYLNNGLPPGPINNPGRESMISVLEPDKTDFLFFVADGRGYHVFTRNENEHNIAKKRFKEFRRKMKYNNN